MTPLTANFTREELACKHCGKMEIPLHVVQMLQKVRDKVGFPLKINSGYRCPEYNAQLAETGSNGPHTVAAFDIAADGRQAFAIIKAAIEVGFTGIGVSQKGSGRFVHIDYLPTSHPRPMVWSY